MKDEVIYLKISQNVEVDHQKVFLKDIAKLYGIDKRRVSNIGNLLVFDINSKKDCKYVFSVMRIIELICEEYPSILIMNLGENDFVLEYKTPTRMKLILEYGKTIFVALIIFLGSAFTIMTFNTDVSVDKVFDLVYTLIMGDPKKGGSVLEISYSIGLPIGIIIFFNHFSKLKIKDDPTPMQIEMRLYEENINKALIQDSGREGNTFDSN